MCSRCHLKMVRLSLLLLAFCISFPTSILYSFTLAMSWPLVYFHTLFYLSSSWGPEVLCLFVLPLHASPSVTAVFISLCVSTMPSSSLSRFSVRSVFLSCTFPLLLLYYFVLFSAFYPIGASIEDNQRETSLSTHLSLWKGHDLWSDPTFSTPVVTYAYIYLSIELSFIQSNSS